MEKTVKIRPFEQHTEEYEAWFEKYPFVFQSELEAITEQLPEKGLGIEVGLGTGRYAAALGIKEGVEPAEHMRELAIRRNLEVLDAVAEDLPYSDMRFDFVLMVTICHMENIRQAFQEAYRVLKRGGVLVCGFIDKDRPVGQAYEARKSKSTFYRHATFYSVDQVADALHAAGFKYLNYVQTLFKPLDDIQETEPVKEGYGEGSFVVVCAMKTT